MSRIYKCIHFGIKELVPPEVYEKYGEMAWQFIDERAARTLDVIRDRHGKTIVNTWYKGGRFKYSGLRPSGCKEGALFSQHKFGRGFDPKPLNVSATDVRRDIIRNRGLYPYITCLEMGIKWVHFDCRNVDTLEGLFLIYPKKKKKIEEAPV